MNGFLPGPSAFGIQAVTALATLLYSLRVCEVTPLLKRSPSVDSRLWQVPKYRCFPSHVHTQRSNQTAGCRQCGGGSTYHCIQYHHLQSQPPPKITSAKSGLREGLQASCASWNVLELLKGSMSSPCPALVYLPWLFLAWPLRWGDTAVLERSYGVAAP